MCVFLKLIVQKVKEQKFGDIIGSEYLSYLSACHRFRFASYPHVLSITSKTSSFQPFNVYAVMENCPVSYLVCLCCSLMVEQLYMFKRPFLFPQLAILYIYVLQGKEGVKLRKQIS